MARGINKVILVGNLGADPETRAMPSGTTVANLRIATSESWRDKQSGEQQERTEWHRVALFGGLFLGAMTMWFLLWLGFLQIMPLSQVLPWEGLSPVLLVLGASVFLREKGSKAPWIGILFISAGVVLVSLS